MKKPKLKKYPTGGSKGFNPDTLVHYVGQGESPYSREQLGSMGYNYQTSNDGFDEYSFGDNRRFYKTVLPNTPEWSNPENPYLTSNTNKSSVAKMVPKPKYPSYGSPEYIKAHPEYTPPKPRIPTFAGGGEFAPIPEKDSLYIEDRLKKDPYLSAKYKYKVVEDRKKGDVLYRTMPNGKDVPVNFANMKELDRQAYKVKMDRDLQSTGQKPIYNVFAPPTFKHGGMKLPKYLPGGEHESTSMIEDYRAEDGSSFWDGANGQESYYKSQEPVASAADQQQIDNNKPNYGAIAGATTGAVANSMVAYNRPDTNVSMKAEANRNGVASIAGSINPMVGGIIAGANAIAKPIKNKAERMDSQGNLVNQKGAQAGAIAGNFLSPSTLATTIADGKWDLTGKKYANSLEADAKARIAEEQAPMLAAAEAKRNMYYTYAQGGTKGDPTIEKNKKFLEDYYKETFNNSVYRTLPEDVKTMDILTKTIGDYMYKLPGTDEQKYSGKTYDSFLNGIQDIRKKYPARPGYSNGGIHSGMPNAEVEKEEVMRMPNGQTTQVDGPSHDNGGVPVNIPDGTQIFSDRLKDPNSKKTFAKMAEKYKTNKQDKILNNPKADKTAKSTAELVAQIKQAKLDKLFETQEQLKQTRLNKYAQKLGLDPNTMFPNGGIKNNEYIPYNPSSTIQQNNIEDPYMKASIVNNFNKKKELDELNYQRNLGTWLHPYQEGKEFFNDVYKKDSTSVEDKYNKYAKYSNGGTKLPKYINGGFGYIDPKNLQLAQQAQSGFPTMEEVEDPSFNNALYNKYQTPFIRPSEAERLKNERSNSKQQYVPNPNDPYEQAMAAGKEFEQPAKKQFNPKTGKYDWVEPAANTLMQNAGNLAYLAGEGKKYDKQDFYKYNPELYNPADALRQADIEARVTRGRLKDASGGNAGALMSNLQQSQALNTLGKSKIRTDANNMNNQILNDAQARNIAGKYQVDDINARNKGQALTNYYKAIQGIGQNTSAAYSDWKRGNMDQNTAKFMSSMFKDYGLDMNNPNDWKIFYKRASNKGEK